MGRARLGEERVPPRLGRDDAHVAGRRLRDQAGDAVAVLGEHPAHGLAVAEGQHEGQLGRRGGHPGGPRDREGRQAAARRGEQAVDVAVVAAGELHDQVAPGEAARQADGRHGGLRPGGDEADGVDARAVDDLLGQLHLGHRRGPVRRPAPHGVQDRRLDLGVGVPEQHRAPRPDQVHELATVGVGEPRPAGGRDEARGPADGAEGAHGGVHAAGGHAPGALEEGRRGGGVLPAAVGLGSLRWGRHAPHCPARSARTPTRSPRSGVSSTTGG